MNFTSPCNSVLYFDFLTWTRLTNHTQNHDTKRNNLAVEPFQPVLEILKQLEEEDTELAFQAARLVWYYRCLWESCVSKHTDGKQLEEANEKLRAGNIQLCNEGSHLKLRQDEQVARLHSIKNALDEVRGNLLGVLKVWNDRSAGDLAILPGDGRFGAVSPQCCNFGVRR
ncbi:unnamed protein product [Penicillium camemberti]|uniref:Str. FM013 n=1 Tax=Penicillium camemberti (strain FM 013) TaxID=1429867 RepID=A0A0G4PN14_PENC3|nr:unnamed protein product [Penicillium camemberti]